MYEKTKIIGLSVCLLLLIGIGNAGLADAGKYGEVDAWFKKTDGEWQNATATPTLKIGEPFWIKVRISNKERAVADFRIYEPGETKAFEVIDGPSKSGEWVAEEWKDANWSDTYQWKLKTTGNWTYGNAPLNILVQFTVEEYGDYYDDTARFSIVNAYISGEEWQDDGDNDDNGNDTGDNGNTTDDGEGGNGLPGFEGLLVVASMLIALAVLQIKRKRWQE